MNQNSTKLTYSLKILEHNQSGHRKCRPRWWIDVVFHQTHHREQWQILVPRCRQTMTASSMYADCESLQVDCRLRTLQILEDLMEQTHSCHQMNLWTSRKDNVQSSGGVSSLQEICWTNPSHHDTEEPPSSDGMPLTTPDRSCKLVARWSAPSEVACLPTHAPAQPRGGWTEDVFRGESFHMEWCHISHRCDNQPSLDVVARDQNLECGLHGIVICTVICIYT